MKEKQKYINKINSVRKQFLINQLIQEKDFAAYFHILNRLKSNFLILIAVKDTPGFRLSTDEQKILNKLGLTERFEGRHWHSYIAVINCGTILDEKISVNDEDIEEKLVVEKHNIRLFSSVYMKANTAEIVIDDINYAVNSRGFNIVIFDWNKEMVVDSVSFDKLVRHHYTVRKEDMLMTRIKELETEIKMINKHLENFENHFMIQAEKTQLMLWQCYRTEREELSAAKERFFLSLPKASGELRDLQLAGLILLTKFDHICRKNNIQYWLSFGGLLGAIRHHGCIPWDDDLDVAMMRDEYERLKAVIFGDRDFCIKEIVCVSIGTLNHCFQFAYKLYDVEVVMDIFIYDYAVEMNKIVIQQQIELNQELAREGKGIAKSLGIDLSKGDAFYEYASAPPEFIRCFEKYNKKAFESYGKSKEEAKGMIWSIDNFIYLPAAKTNKNLAEVFPLRELELEGHMFWAPFDAVKYVTDMYGDAFSIPDDMDTHRHFRMDSKQRKNLHELLEKYKYILEEEADYIIV